MDTSDKYPPLNIDWLSIFCTRNQPDFISVSNQYSFKQLNITTQLFKNVGEIYQGTQRIATVAYNPHSGILKPAAAQIKIDNKLLYCLDVHKFLLKLLSDFNLTFNNISRIDICSDFNLFSNNLHPESFISNFLTGIYRPPHRTTYTVTGLSTTKLNHQYIRFGNPVSNFCWYIYNKSLEMKKKTFKPWILDQWRKSQLDISKDVWRLEFRLHYSSFDFIDTISGNCISFKTLDPLLHENLKDIFNFLLYKHTAFFKASSISASKKKHSVNLLPMYNNYLELYSNTEDLESNRMDKIVIKKLDQFYNHMREISQDNHEHIQKAITDYCTKKQLVKWYHEKVL